MGLQVEQLELADRNDVGVDVSQGNGEVDGVETHVDNDLGAVDGRP